jgi:hypothetical protein
MRKLLQSLFGKPQAADTAAPTLFVDLPFETILVPGHEAPAVRQKLLAKEGVTPVILGAEEDIQLMVDLLDASPQSLTAVLLESEKVDAAAWLEQRRRGDEDAYALEPGAWPHEARAAPGLSVHLQVLSGQPKKNVLLALFPTPRSWETPAHMRYGGWNECPPAPVHVALHKRWHQAFGADIACMSSDVIECTVARPPATREAALALAREQFLYCPDIVHQGTQTLESLAATLLGARTWYFWWD